MFDQMRAMSAVAGLLKNKDKIQAALERVKSSAHTLRAQGEAGGGAARATVDGTLRVLAVEISPALAAGMAADERTRELAASLIAQAVNDAMTTARTRLAELVESEARAAGIDLGDLPMLGDLRKLAGLGGP